MVRPEWPMLYGARGGNDMTRWSYWEAFFTLFTAQAPFVAACACGLLLALVRYRRHPAASRLLALGLLLWLASAVAGTLLFGPFVETLIEGGGFKPFTAQQFSALFFSILRAAALALVVAAVYAGRTRPFTEGERNDR
jgi:hypothetical protein